MCLLDLLNKYIFLVEEEYDGSSSKVAVVADTVEQVETLVHSVLKETNEESEIVSLTAISEAYLALLWHYMILPLHHPPPAPCRKHLEQQ